MPSHSENRQQLYNLLELSIGFGGKTPASNESKIAKCSCQKYMSILSLSANPKDMVEIYKIKADGHFLECTEPHFTILNCHEIYDSEVLH